MCKEGCVCVLCVWCMFCIYNAFIYIPIYRAPPTGALVYVRAGFEWLMRGGYMNICVMFDVHVLLSWTNAVNDKICVKSLIFVINK